MVLVDRYDMYFGAGIELIERFWEAGVVLVDCKSHAFPFSTKQCNLLFEGDKIVVF